MSFASKVLYTGDAVTTDFNVPMPYIARTDVNVYVNEILQLTSMHYTWSGASTISFSSAPGSGDAIEIRRWTSPTATLVDFVDGSVLNANDLDTAYLHNFYLSQEYADSFNEVINEMLVRVATAEGIEATEPDQVILELVASMVDSAAAANLQARITDIDDNAEAIITLGEGLQVQINTLAQGVSADVYIQDDEPVPGVGGVPNPILEGSRWYDSDDNNTPYIYLSSVWVSIADPRVGAADAAIEILQVDYNNIYSAIVQEQFVRSTENTGFAQQLNLLGVQNGDQSAFILDLDTASVSPTESLADRFTNITAAWAAADVVAVADADAAAILYTDAEIVIEQTARSNAVGAVASDVTSLDARVVTNEGLVPGIATNAGQIVTDRGVAASATSAVASDVTTLTARVGVTEGDIGTNAAQIVTDRGVAASATGAVASDLTTLETEVDDNSAAVIVHAASIDGIEADYGVELNVNGYVQGFRIINGGTPGENAFVIMADKFAIVDPSGDPGESEYVPFEISGGKINMRSDVKIDGDLMVTGTINGGALINGTIGSTQIGANAISTTHISALTIAAGDIAANAITADKINVTNLAAVNADLGSITAGNITLDSSGYIKGGQTAYDTGTGFFLGYSGAYKFSIGNGTTQKLTWDGTTLEVLGNVIVGEYIVDAVEIAAAANTERTRTSTTYAQVKGFTLDRSGDVRVSWEYKHPLSGYQNAGIRVKVNGNVVFTHEEGTVSGWTVEYDDQFSLVAGDTVTIEHKAGKWYSDGPEPSITHLKNARILAIVNLPATITVDDD